MNLSRLGKVEETMGPWGGVLKVRKLLEYSSKSQAHFCVRKVNLWDVVMVLKMSKLGKKTHVRPESEL